MARTHTHTHTHTQTWDGGCLPPLVDQWPRPLLPLPLRRNRCPLRFPLFSRQGQLCCHCCWSIIALGGAVGRGGRHTAEHIVPFAVSIDDDLHGLGKWIRKRLLLVLCFDINVFILILINDDNNTIQILKCQIEVIARNG